MTNKYYRAVDVKERNPEKCNNTMFSEFVTVYEYDTCIGEGYYNHSTKTWIGHNNVPIRVTHWLEEYTPLTGYNVIEKLGKDLSWDETIWLTASKGEGKWHKLTQAELMNIVSNSQSEKSYLVQVPQIEKEKLIEIVENKLPINFNKPDFRRFTESIVDALLPFINTDIKKEEK